MYIKIRGFWVGLSLLLATAIVFMGYICLGVSLHDHYVRSLTDGFTWLWLTGLLIGGAWSITQNRGGVVAGLVPLGLALWRYGWQMGLWALGIAVVVLWVGLQDVDPDREPVTETPLRWQEWLALLVTVALACPLSFAVLNTTPIAFGAYSLGIFAGGLALLGAQLQNAELPKPMTMIALGVLGITGFSLGWLYHMINRVPFNLA
ncbi:MAG: hypothetical protein ACK5QS_07400 [Pseudanabaenaceae cyanobacterium]|jgi:hypothetical protein